MISEGKRLHKKFGKCATIKVPCTYEGLLACANLSVEGIKVNVTLIFSQAQAILAAKAWVGHAGKRTHCSVRGPGRQDQRLAPPQRPGGNCHEAVGVGARRPPPLV